MSTKKEKRYEKRRLIIQSYLEINDMLEVQEQFNITSTELIDLITRYDTGGLEALKDGYRMVTPNSIFKSQLDSVVNGCSSQYEVSSENKIDMKETLSEINKRKSKL